MEEGPRALYKGLMPTLLQIVPQTGFQFGFYKLFRSTWEYAAGDSGNGLHSNIQLIILQHTNIGSDNGLVPNRRQAIIWTNAAILSIRP